MADPNRDKVANLLQQGLESYGTGDVARAFLLWQEALDLDPGNEEALDYMRDADRRAKPRGPGLAPGAARLLDEARRLVREESEEAALELLSSAPRDVGLEGEAMVDLLRARLFQRYCDKIGDLDRVPRLTSTTTGDLQSRNLPPSAGFLLSMIDGRTALGDLVSVSGMDRFEVLRSLHRMLEAGLLEWAS